MRAPLRQLLYHTVLSVSLLAFLSGCKEAKELLPVQPQQTELVVPPQQEPNPQPKPKPEPPEPEVKPEPVDWPKEIAHARATRAKLKTIAGALIQYDAKYQCFWPDIKRGPEFFDSNKNLLLSWRVHLLPFLGQKKLYEQFRLTDPWNSPHNLKLIEKIPDVYLSSDDDRPGHTRFRVFTGAGAPMFLGFQVGIRNIVDGTVNTLLVAESGTDQTVPWTKPEEIPFDPRTILSSIGKISPAGLHVTNCAGQVYSLKPDISADDISKLITNQGKEEIAIADFKVDLDQLAAEKSETKAEEKDTEDSTQKDPATESENTPDDSAKPESTESAPEAKSDA